MSSLAATQVHVRQATQMVVHRSTRRRGRTDGRRLLWRTGTWLLLVPALLSGCAVGPRLAAPEVRAPNVYIRNTETVGPRLEPLRATSSVAVQWWTLFRTPLLNHYIRAAMRVNPDLATARAALTAEDDLVHAAAAGFLPHVAATAVASRARALTAGANSGRAYRIPGDLYSLLLGSVVVSYQPDVFGSVADQLHSAEARREVTAAQLRMTEVFLQASVARAVIQAAGAREQWKAAQRIATDDQRLLELLRQEYRLGASNLQEVRQQKALTASAKAAIPPLRTAMATYRNALSDLVGEFPDETLLLPRLNTMQLPATLPTVLPSTLLEQRPDIVAARAETEAARADARLAAANRFPQVQISADLGKAAQSGAMFFNPLSTLWSLGTGILAPLYDGGALANEEKAATAEYRASSGRYRATVLKAFEQVADALRALRDGEQTLRQSQIASTAAAQALTLARARYRDGDIAYSAVLDAQIAAQRDIQAAIAARTQHYLDTVALFLALGEGGSSEHSAVSSGARS